MLRGHAQQLGRLGSLGDVLQNVRRGNAVSFTALLWVMQRNVCAHLNRHFDAGL
jgi:hypothetical protein